MKTAARRSPWRLRRTTIWFGTVVLLVTIIGMLIYQAAMDQLYNHVTPEKPISYTRAQQLAKDCRVIGTFEHMSTNGIFVKGQGRIVVDNVSMEDIYKLENPACPFTMNESY